MSFKREGFRSLATRWDEATRYQLKYAARSKSRILESDAKQAPMAASGFRSVSPALGRG